MVKIQLKRAYDPESDSDGYRIYIDRIWPRGLSHATFHYDLWEKQVSPSTELREWFHADMNGRWPEFKEKYKAELLKNPAFNELKNLVQQKDKVTLLYSSRNREENNAVVLKELL